MLTIYTTLWFLLITNAQYAHGVFCTRWLADSHGEQIPKLLYDHGLDFAIHGAWNLTKKGSLPCNGTDVDKYFVNHTIPYLIDLSPNDFGNCCTTQRHEYCKHGASYGYTIEEYFAILNNACNSPYWYVYSCRYDRHHKCNVPQQNSTILVSSPIGCVGTNICDSTFFDIVPSMYSLSPIYARLTNITALNSSDFQVAYYLLTAVLASSCIQIIILAQIYMHIIEVPRIHKIISLAVSGAISLATILGIFGHAQT